MSRSSTVRSDLLLLLAALIWGFAFVAQRMGMEHVGPFLFNAIRFAMGAGLLGLIVWLKRVKGDGEMGGRGEEETGGPGDQETADRRPPTADRRPGTGDRRSLTADRRPPTAYPRYLTISGLLLGLILFTGATFQQAGIVYTTAGNAGFITGLYVILVPVFGMITGQRAGSSVWGGAVLATAGLYFLSVTENFTMLKGDLLVLIGSIFWAVHVLYTGWLSPRTSVFRLAITQYAVCAALSLVAAFLFESNSLDGICRASVPLLYGGLLSVGVAFTLQIVGQKKAPPAHTAVILSLEAVFAVVGGVILLSETMTERKWIGCSLMLCGMLLAQVRGRSQRSAVSGQQSAVIKH